MTNYFERDLRGKKKYRVYNDINQCKYNAI